MAKLFKLEHGDQFGIAVPSGEVSGNPVLIGPDLIGVLLTNRNTDGNATIKRDGSCMLSVQAVNGGGNSAVAVGDLIYINMAGTPRLSKVATGVHFGYALGTVTSGATATIEVLLAAK